jgi:hypothetical protein
MLIKTLMRIGRGPLETAVSLCVIGINAVGLRPFRTRHAQSGVCYFRRCHTVREGQHVARIERSEIRALARADGPIPDFANASSGLRSLSSLASEKGGVPCGLCRLT